MLAVAVPFLAFGAVTESEAPEAFDPDVVTPKVNEPFAWLAVGIFTWSCIAMSVG